jgi:hypothetical protein
MDGYGGGSGLVVCTVFKTAGRRQWWLRWVRFPHAPAKPLAVLICIAGALLPSRPASAQIPFPTPSARQDTSGKDTIKVPAFRFEPPTPPLAAMARSMLLPGWGQAMMGRRVTGAGFVFWEGVTLTMTLKASHQLRYDEAINSTKVDKKRQEVQDWLVLLVFNHLFAGAEAFVAAQLWDFPAQVELRPVPGGVAAGFRVYRR